MTNLAHSCYFYTFSQKLPQKSYGRVGVEVGTYPIMLCPNPTVVCKRLKSLRRDTTKVCSQKGHYSGLIPAALHQPLIIILCLNQPQIYMRCTCQTHKGAAGKG